jgi:hypothetical protein
MLEYFVWINTLLLVFIAVRVNQLYRDRRTEAEQTAEQEDDT